MGISNCRSVFTMKTYQSLDKKLEGDYSDDTDYLIRIVLDEQDEKLQLAEEMFSFLNDLTDPEMYGWAVSEEVRKKASELKKYLSVYVTD